ncbi:MAG: tricarballylate utilization 4Fe-4S protein TcuB [Gammaproteobacteria bacterium]
MRLCNACRYCEGHCAVFPAMERRLDFRAKDVVYLANLCHGCGSCYHHCQYAPPHEFAVDVPDAFAAVRLQTYRDYAWPRALGALYERNGLAVAIVTAVSLVAFLLGTMWLADAAVLYAAQAGNFYAVIPHGVMVGLFGTVGAYVVAAAAVGYRRFVRDLEPRAPARPGAMAASLHDALTLKNLRGGGDGCTYPGERPSHARRFFHHFTFYGFLLCFAATSVATLYHYAFGWKAPYALTSLPVLLGTVGGVGLLIGPAGLLWLKQARKPDGPVSPEPGDGMDLGFLALLFLTSLTGLLLLVLRNSPAMGVLLAVHLGVVLGLFLTLPYGKFMHAIYRVAALRQAAREARAEMGGDERR